MHDSYPFLQCHNYTILPMKQIQPSHRLSKTHRYSTSQPNAPTGLSAGAPSTSAAPKSWIFSAPHSSLFFVSFRGGGALLSISFWGTSPLGPALLESPLPAFRPIIWRQPQPPPLGSSQPRHKREAQRLPAPRGRRTASQPPAPSTGAPRPDQARGAAGNRLRRRGAAEGPGGSLPRKRCRPAPRQRGRRSSRLGDRAQPIRATAFADLASC